MTTSTDHTLTESITRAQSAAIDLGRAIQVRERMGVRRTARFLVVDAGCRPALTTPIVEFDEDGRAHAPRSEGRQ